MDQIFKLHGPRSKGYLLLLSLALFHTVNLQLLAPVNETFVIDSDEPQINYHQKYNWDGICATGTQQSPVPLPPERDMTDATGISQLVVSATRHYSRTLTLNYFELYTDLFGGMVKFTNELGEMEYWVPYEIRLHSPSEHTFGGIIEGYAHPFDVELQIYHTNNNTANDDRLFLSVMFDAELQMENVFLRDLDLNNIGAPVTVDLKELFSQFSDMSYYTYEGSLPRPPCTENVRWVIMKERLPMSQHQKNYFLDFWLYNETVGFLGNDRNLQNIGFRNIYRVDMPGSLFEQNARNIALSTIFALVSLVYWL